MDVKFQAAVRELLETSLTRYFGKYIIEKSRMSILHKMACVSMFKRLEETSSFDTPARFDDLAKHLVGVILDNLTASNAPAESYALLQKWKPEFVANSAKVYLTLREQMHTTALAETLADAKDNLGRTYAVYEYVRREIGVTVRKGDVAEGKHGRSIGSNVSAIVEAMRDGRLVGAVGSMLAAH